MVPGRDWNSLSLWDLPALSGVHPGESFSWKHIHFPLEVMQRWWGPHSCCSRPPGSGSRTTYQVLHPWVCVLCPGCPVFKSVTRSSNAQPSADSGIELFGGELGRFISLGGFRDIQVRKLFPQILVCNTERENCPPFPGEYECRLPKGQWQREQGCPGI